MNRSNTQTKYQVGCYLIYLFFSQYYMASQHPGDFQSFSLDQIVDLFHFICLRLLSNGTIDVLKLK